MFAEQIELIKTLKADMKGNEEDTKCKRTREEESEALQFQFKEPEVGERAIATNKRVGFFQMEPRTKSVAWGLAAFAVGMGAVCVSVFGFQVYAVADSYYRTFLPSLL